MAPMKTPEEKRKAKREACRRQRAANPEVSRRAAQRWRVANSEYYREYSREYQVKRRREDPAFKLLHTLRTRLRSALKGKSKAASTIELLGCTAEFARAHIESTWQSGWNWENHGPVWHVDHKVPCDQFDLLDPEQQRQCFHWTNLRSYPAFDNLSEGA